MQVSPLCLGAMMFGAWGETDHDTSIGIIHHALDEGIHFVDTADVYSQASRRPSSARRWPVVAGTTSSPASSTARWALTSTRRWHRGRPEPGGQLASWIVTEVENSLRRLQTDWIDLYQVHRPDPDTDIEETLGALTELQQAGKTRAFGCSTNPAHQLVEAHWTSECRGLGRR